MTTPVVRWSITLAIWAVFFVLADRSLTRKAAREGRTHDPAERATSRLIYLVLAVGGTIWVNIVFVWRWGQALAFFAGWAAVLGSIRLAHAVYQRRHHADDSAN